MEENVVLFQVTEAGAAALLDSSSDLSSALSELGTELAFPADLLDLIPSGSVDIKSALGSISVVLAVDSLDGVFSVLDGQPGTVGASWIQPLLGMQPTPPSRQGYLFGLLTSYRYLPNPVPRLPFARLWGVGVSELGDTSAELGQGSKVWIVERSWDFAGVGGTADPIGVPVPPIYSSPFLSSPSLVAGDRRHGTRDYSLLAMDRVEGRGWGVAPQAEFSLVAAPYVPNTRLQLYIALLVAAVHGKAGEILLVEEQMIGLRNDREGGRRAACVDMDPVVCCILDLAVRGGMVPILPAGNGSENLADLVMAEGPEKSLPSWTWPAPEVIRVGGVSPVTSGRSLESNFGDSVHCCAWSSNVYALQVHFNPVLKMLETVAVYDHGGTSSAAAIVAGVAAVAQALNLAKGNAPLTSATMIDLLRTGGTQTQGTNDKIGVMPNLGAIKAALGYNQP